MNVCGNLCICVRIRIAICVWHAMRRGNELRCELVLRDCCGYMYVYWNVCCGVKWYCVIAVLIYDAMMCGNVCLAWRGIVFHDAMLGVVCMYIGMCDWAVKRGDTA